jgi:ubiquinone/menaquinone biosynthesis C-methylase UbiE
LLRKNNIDVVSAPLSAYEVKKHTQSAPYFSANGIKLHTLSQIPESYVHIKYFDLAAQEYEMATHLFKEPIVEATFREIRPFIRDHSFILDCGCGPGYEAISLSEWVPKGEVVAVDLSYEMIRLAYRNAKYHFAKNMAFYQADVHNLPKEFTGRFDIIYCQLSCSYFHSLPVAARNLYNVLDDDGIVFLIEPEPTIMNRISIPFAKAANPFFKQLYKTEDLKSIFISEGFGHFSWKEILPGIGIGIISKFDYAK